MRLINTETLELEEYTDYELPEYAILSHTWGKEEMSFWDLQSAEALSEPGHDKIKNCCSRAAADGLKYAWVYTCCIDKTSSAELSEAINSMYRWYKRSKVCYAYLSDVSQDSINPKGVNRAIENSLVGKAIGKSNWFKRGWTLQELIAPQQVMFFADDWSQVGTKAGWSIWLSEVTGINEGVLLGKSPERVPVAHRMSWAAGRQTTRVEDIAYSLMGLFGVNMPMIYGEGEMAFVRLQEEIMKRTHDRSLFAWKSADNSYRGLLARSPAEFASCKELVRDKYPPEYTSPSAPGLVINNFGNSFSSLSGTQMNEIDTPFSQTNMGLCIRSPLIDTGRGTVEAVLDWRYKDEKHRVRIAMESLPNGKNQFVRRFWTISPSDEDEKCNIQTIYVKQFFDVQYTPRVPKSSHIFHVRVGPDLIISQVYPPGQWNKSDRILKVPAERPCVAGVLLLEINTNHTVGSKKRKLNCVVYLGCDNEACCWAYIGQKGGRRLKQLLCLNPSRNTMRDVPMVYLPGSTCN